MSQSGRILQQRYKIEKQIGQGGMGAVYVAVDERFGSTVAIKQTLCMDDNYRKAIEREARLLNSLKHIALPRVSDHFVENEGQYIVMEFIPGEDLSCILETQGHPFNSEQVLKWADQLLDALDFLHNQANPVIHRDIKPQNLKIMPDGQIILLDFGLAKGNPTDAKNNTAAKSIFGYSRNYASLEQIQGTGTDPRSDLYSLAATLYHLVTGVPPEDALTRAMAVLTHQPDPLKPAHLLNELVPPGFSAILQQTLDLNSGKRPATAAEMRSMLRRHSDFASAAATYVEPADQTGTVLHDQKTKLMHENTAAIATGQTSHKTEVLPASVSHLTVARGPDSGVSGNSQPVVTGGSGRKLAWSSAGLAALLLAGAGIGGVLYYENAAPETADPISKDAVPAPLMDTSSGNSGFANDVSTLGNESALQPNGGQTGLTEPEKAAAETKRSGAANTQQDRTSSSASPAVEDIVVDGDTVYMGNKKITPDGIEPIPRGEVPVPPVTPEIRLTPEQFRDLTPAQRRRLRNIMRRNANVVVNPTP